MHHGAAHRARVVAPTPAPSAVAPRRRILPSSDIAYLTGAGLVSMNRLMCSGISLSCSLSAVAKSPLWQAVWNSEHSRGATLDVTEMQPWPPCAMKPSAVTSSPEVD